MTRPRWLGQFVVLAFISITVSILMHPHVVRLTLDHLPSSATAQDKFNVEQTLRQELGIACAFLPIRLIIGWVSFALVLFYTCKAWGTHEAVRFHQVFSLEVVAESVMVFAQIALLASIFVSGRPSSFLKIPFGLDMFDPSGDTLSHMALNSINVFSVWYIVSLSLGISVLYGLTKVKSFITILAVWSLLIFFKMGIVYLLRDALSLKL